MQIESVKIRMGRNSCETTRDTSFDQEAEQDHKNGKKVGEDQLALESK